MDLIAFRVTMYKGILDSGWVDVNPLTVLVGKNESGKTSLLKALHKLNPYTPDPYVMAKEWPRARRRQRRKEQKVCLAKFQLSDEEKFALSEIAEREGFPDTVEVSRNYAGQLEVDFGEEIFSDELHPNDVDNACDNLPKIQVEFNDQFKQVANECLEEVRRLAHDGRFSELKELPEKHNSLLQAAPRSSSIYSPQIEEDFMYQYTEGLRQLVRKLEQLPSTQSKVHEYVINHLPTFIYMDDYRSFRGTAQLDEVRSRQSGDQLEVRSRQSRDRLTEEDKTFLTILNLSALDLDELVGLGQGGAANAEQRQYDLDDGAATLTAEISDRLRQRNYKVEYRVDGQRFLTFVKDDRDPALIQLEERSKGFQWFFSFDLMFMHESKGTFEGCVILLDEPGLHLHPEAQKDLLRRLEHYADGNTLLYTTHLPFMIDLNSPNRIRVLKETDNGIAVTTDLVESPPEAKFVLQAAIGMDASQSLLFARRNLVVEGVNDYYILTELSNLLQQDGKKGLPKDVRVTPGAGASQAIHVTTLMIGQNLSVVTLFDSDNAGRDARDKLVKNWITRYTTTNTEVILLGDAVGAEGDFALEDLFPDDFITDIVKEVYSKELVSSGVDNITLHGEDMLWKRIERFMTKKEIKITKGAIATRWRKKLSDMKDFNELPKETQGKTIKLFDVIRDAFAEE